MMVRVELIYDTTCPNVEKSRRQLRQAFGEAKVRPRWKEWNRAETRVPNYVRTFGSPTVLINGRDVAESAPTDGADCCRVYADDEGRMAGVPSIEAIRVALDGAGKPRGGWAGFLAAVPGVGAALVPGLSCPACWPAYAGLLSSLGIGFVNYTPYFLPLTAVFLVVALVALAFRARQRHGLGPFFLGCVGATALMFGRFVPAYPPALYAGAGLLIASSVWNAWPKGRSQEPVCRSCAKENQ